LYQPSVTGLELAPWANIRIKDNIMAIDVHEGGSRPEPGLALALLAVLVMVLTTAVLSVLIYVLMLAVSATSAGSRQAPSASEPPAVVSPATPITK
jgi:hypothetical protein